MFYPKVTKLFFNNGDNIEINHNDIVIFVGPNNCGKSQSLKDIRVRISESLDTMVINDVEVEKGSFLDLKENIINNSKCEVSSNPVYLGYGYRIFESTFNENFYNSNKLHVFFRDYLVSFLNTEERLSISNAPNAIDADEPKTHPIHYVLYDREYQKTITKYFREAFGYDLTPNYLSRKRIHLMMGDIPRIERPGIAPDIIDELEIIFKSYPRIDEQGDGMRSFTGVILHLILKNYGIFLIDEPESFLHPPQAKILGKVIGELLGDDRQAFISTHSEDIIKGLIDVCPDRIKVIRITRHGNINSFAHLNNDQFKTIWGDPLLKHSNIMSSLFHKNVVLCESDSDCRFYSIVLDYLKKQEGKYSETLFIYSNGKQRMKHVVKALNSLSLEYKCIPDIDVFNDKQVLKDLYEASGGEWNESLNSNYDTFVSQLNGGKTSVTKVELQEQINSFLKGISEDILDKRDIENLEKYIKIETKWSILKKGGIDSIPSGQAKVSFNILHEALKAKNIYPVPVGELERFVSEVGGHGPSWVNAVLEQYPELNDQVYNKVKVFVQSWNI